MAPSETLSNIKFRILEIIWKILFETRWIFLKIRFYDPQVEFNLIVFCKMCYCLLLNPLSPLS